MIIISIFQIMRIHPLLTSSKFIILALWLIIIMAVLHLILIFTGNYALWQTSEVTELGICTQDSSLGIVKIVPHDMEILFICGKLTGETKRSLSIRLFYEDQGVFHTSGNWPAGIFFIPVEAVRLRNMETEVFLPGTYRIGISYARPIAFESTFEVSTE